MAALSAASPSFRRGERRTTLAVALPFQRAVADQQLDEGERAARGGSVQRRSAGTVVADLGPGRQQRFGDRDSRLGRRVARTSQPQRRVAVAARAFDRMALEQKTLNRRAGRRHAPRRREAREAPPSRRRERCRRDASDRPRWQSRSRRQFSVAPGRGPATCRSARRLACLRRCSLEGRAGSSRRVPSVTDMILPFPEARRPLAGRKGRMTRRESEGGLSPLRGRVAALPAFGKPRRQIRSVQAGRAAIASALTRPELCRSFQIMTIESTDRYMSAFTKVAGRAPARLLALAVLSTLAAHDDRHRARRGTTETGETGETADPATDAKRRPSARDGTRFRIQAQPAMATEARLQVGSRSRHRAARAAWSSALAWNMRSRRTGPLSEAMSSTSPTRHRSLQRADLSRTSPSAWTSATSRWPIACAPKSCSSTPMARF